MVSRKQTWTMDGGNWSLEVECGENGEDLLLRVCGSDVTELPMTRDQFKALADIYYQIPVALRVEEVHANA